MSRAVYEKAFAKVNLSLEVTGRRADGLHELVSLVQTVSLLDELKISESAGGADRVTFVNCPLLSDLPAPQNLVLRAVRLAREFACVDSYVNVEVTKNIPLAAGLGGGSADAAACLRGLFRLWGVKPTARELVNLAQQLGSDVPVLLKGGLALVTGAGEQVTMVAAPKAQRKYALLTFKHDTQGKTARAYQSLRADMFSDGAVTRRLVNHIAGGGRMQPRLARNVFGEVYDALYPDLSVVKSEMEQRLGLPLLVSGAGPTLFFALENGQDSELSVLSERAQGLEWHVVSATDSAPTEA